MTSTYLVDSIIIIIIPARLVYPTITGSSHWHAHSINFIQDPLPSSLDKRVL